MVFAAQDKWRKHPLIANGYKAAFPGLRNAVILFAGYCAVEYVYDSVYHPKPKFDPNKLHWSKEEIGGKPSLEDDNQVISHSHHDTKNELQWQKIEVGVKPDLVED